MGIKGIYGEIGVGERKALYKLAIEKFEETGRPFRVAIDIAIWQYQIQAGKGGSDPAIRTLYYRLLRLLSLCIQPLFVFDGPHKPPFKRNKRTGSGGATVSNMLTKQLIKYFGFPYHQAPGEAEAECALLQQHGIVDAVLSEDVDTLMFGSNLCLRNWSSEGQRGNKAPTHVSIYSRKIISEKYGLDREGMILVALMSGGDYNTEGIPGCGIKLACEAAKAGFGKSLCSISQLDDSGYKSWREKLACEIITNNGKFFKTKRKSLKIPQDFPDREILSYYTHPVVSCLTKILKLKDEIRWSREIDVVGLRRFVADAFDWTRKTGAFRFIRGLAPALLVHKLRLNGEAEDSEHGDIILTAMNENELVRAICDRREHFSTDGIPELRLIYHPMDIVRLDLDAEEEPLKDFDRDGLAPRNADGQTEEYILNDESIEKNTNPNPSLYDPARPEKIWVSRTIARIGIPLKVEDYEESLRDPGKFLKAKAAAKKTMTIKNPQNKIKNRHIDLPKSTLACESLPQTRHIKSVLSDKSVSHAYENFKSNKGSYNRSAKTKGTKILSNVPVSSGIKKTCPLSSKDNVINVKPRTQTTEKLFSKNDSQDPSLVKSSKLPFNRITKVCTHDKSEINDSYELYQATKTLINFHPPSKEHSYSNVPSISPTINDEIYGQSVNLCRPRDRKVLNESSTVSKESTDIYENTDNSNIGFDDFSNLETLESEIISIPSSPDLPTVSDLLPKRRRDTVKKSFNDSFGCPRYSTSLHSSVYGAESPITISKINSTGDSNTLKDPQNTKGSLGPKSKRAKKSLVLTSSKAKSDQKKIIMLRDSLPGAWKLVDENHNIHASNSPNRSSNNSREKTHSNAKNAARWRMSQIEFLDMSAE